MQLLLVSWWRLLYGWKGFEDWKPEVEDGKTEEEEKQVEEWLIKNKAVVDNGDNFWIGMLWDCVGLRNNVGLQKHIHLEWILFEIGTVMYLGFVMNECCNVLKCCHECNV